MKLSDYKVLTFDVYGTLIDWESGMVAALKPLTDRAPRALSRDEILQAHAHHESSTQRWTPAKKYSDLLPVVYRRLAEEWGAGVLSGNAGRGLSAWVKCVAAGHEPDRMMPIPVSACLISLLRSVRFNYCPR